MAIPAFCSDQPGAVCCESFWAIAEQLSIVAGMAIRECLGDTCADFPYYVCHGEPIGGGDYVAVWLTAGAPPDLSTTKMHFSPKIRLTYTIALCLDGYPMPRVEQGAIAPVPTPAEHNWASYFSYGAAERMYRSIVNALVVSPTSILGACALRSVGSLTAQQPALGSARWMFQVVADQTP
jgi:hypothetical protein